MSEPRPDLSVDEILAEIERRQPQCLWEGATCFQIPGGGYCDMCLLLAAARALRAQQEAGREAETRLRRVLSDMTQQFGPGWPPNSFSGQRVHDYAVDVEMALAAVASSPRTGSSE